MARSAGLAEIHYSRAKIAGAAYKNSTRDAANLGLEEVLDAALQFEQFEPDPKKPELPGPVQPPDGPPIGGSFGALDDDEPKFPRISKDFLMKRARPRGFWHRL